MKSARSQAGVTLMEMMIVVSLMAVAAAITLPALGSGLESLRLGTAADDIANFLNGGVTRVERQQRMLELTVSVPERRLWLRSADASFVKHLEMPEGVQIIGVYPPVPNVDEQPPERSFLLLPGGVVPRIGVEIANRRGARRLVRIDPITGVPNIERAAPATEPAQ